MRRFLTSLFVYSALSLAQAAWASPPEFPHRGIHAYQGQHFVGLDEVQDRLDSLLVIDVRSGYEYGILHLNGARNIPVDEADFVARLKQAMAEKPGKTVMFYCNGRLCIQSYEAARLASEAGITDTLVFDGGVRALAMRLPERMVFRGGQPFQTDKLLSSELLARHELPPEEFMKRASGMDALVIDIRHHLQHKGISLFAGRDRFVHFDLDAIKPYMEQAKSSSRPLYIVDDSGGQAVWLYYVLEEAGVPEYYTIKGGTQAYFAGLLRTVRRS